MMPHSQTRERRNRWKVLQLILGLTVGPFVLLLVFWPYPCCVASPKTQTLAQLKQIGMAASIYASDHGDRLPPDTSSVRASADALRPYWKNDELMVSRNPGSPEFLGNGSLSGAKVATINEPGQAILFFDSAPWKEELRRTVCFVDASVRRISEADFQKAVATDWRQQPEVHGK